jgi:RNA polymerase sigma-54 factor
MLQSHYQALRPLTSAHLAQTMTLLSLTNDELLQQIESELSTNPALELVEDRRCPSCHRLLGKEGVCPVCSRPQNIMQDEPIVFVSSRDDLNFGDYVSSQDLPEDNFTTVEDDLPTFVLRQIAPELNVKDRLLAAYILTHLDENGFLTVSPFEIASFQHVSLEKVKELIHMIQRCEPLGVGASTPQEALQVQLSVLAETLPVPPLAKLAIEKGMDLLGKHQYSELAKRLKISLSQAKEIANFISDNLVPYPAHTHWGEAHQHSQSNDRNVYHRPDIIISFLNENPNNSLVVEIILPLHGTLRVNPLFRQAVREANEEKKEDWKLDLDRASLFVKCLQQRNHTMKRLMLRVASIQQDFILHGETHLKSLTRVELSTELGVHESTISRAVSSKSVQLPNGRIVPLSRFFSRNLNARSILKLIINKESKPLSDSELTKLLANEGIAVSRRTVAKYRAMEGILPAHLRHPMVGMTT